MGARLGVGAVEYSSISRRVSARSRSVDEAIRRQSVLPDGRCRTEQARLNGLLLRRSKRFSLAVLVVCYDLVCGLKNALGGSVILL